MKHNKKRNIAFIYEALSRELTRAIVEKNFTRRASPLPSTPRDKEYEERDR